MRIYWRIMDDLKEQGETLLFHDPCILREYSKWCRRNGVDYSGTYKVDPFMHVGQLHKPIGKEEGK